MIKQFIRDTGIYGLTGILSKAVSLFLIPFYTRVLTPSDYGIIDILAVFAAIIAITVPLEITQAVARFIAGNKERSAVKEISSTGLILTFSSFLMFFLFCVFFQKPLTKLIIGNADKSGIFLIASLSVFCNGLYYFVQNQLRWLLKPKQYSVVSLLYTVLSISITVFFVLIIRIGVVGIFWAYSISSSLCFLLGYYFSKENYSLIFNFRQLKAMLHFSLPLVPSSVSVLAMNYIQRIMIRALMTLADLGLFGIASRLSSTLNMAFQSIKTALVPLIYQHCEDPQTPGKILILFKYLSCISLIIVVMVSIFAKEIIYILTTPSYHSSYILVPFLMVSEIFEGLSVFTIGLAIVKKTKMIAYINIIGGSLTVFISFIAIYYWGLIGAALAVALKSILLFAIQFNYSQKYYHVPYDIGRSIGAFLFASMFILIGLTIKFQGYYLSIAFKLIVSFVSTAVLILWMRIFKKEDLGKLFAMIKR